MFIFITDTVLCRFKDYSVNFYLRQQWRDKRLTFEPRMENGKKQEILKIEDKIDDIWTPDVFFRNEKEAHFHFVTTSNLMLTLNSTGHLWYVRKWVIQF